MIPFDFNIEHIPGTRMGLVDYLSRQPNQKAKSITQYDEEFMVATISHIRDSILTLFSPSNTIPFQKQHNNSKCQLQVNKTRVHSCNVAKSIAHTPNASNNSLKITAKVNNYNPKIISSFKCQITYSKLILPLLRKSSQTIQSSIQPLILITK